MANKDQDYYEALKSENYKTLLNSEIQLDNARQRALKQSSVGMNAQGLAGSGYQQLANNGIESQYLTGLQNAQQQYQNQNNVINEQQRQENLAQQNSNFESLTTLLSQAGNTEQLSSIMQSMGYMDANGNYTAKYNDLGADNQAQLNTLYNLYNSQLASQNMRLFNYDKKGSVEYYDKNGNVSYIDLNGGGEQGWNKETTALTNAINGGTIGNGSYIALKNDKDNTIYLYYNNGQLYYSSKEDYEKSTNKYNINKYNLTRG